MPLCIPPMSSTPLPSFLAQPLPPVAKPFPSKKAPKKGRKKGSKNKPKQPLTSTLPEPSRIAPVSAAPSGESAKAASAAPFESTLGVSLGAAPAPAITATTPTGGEGVAQPATAGNLDKSTLGVEILQSDEGVEAGVMGGEDSSSSRTPIREVEGILQMSQANKVLEGVIGIKCRNRHYVEVRVGEEWGRCAAGGMNLFQGEKVKVKEVWRSADGRDAEWEVVERVEVPEVYAGGGLARVAGFKGGSANSEAAMGVVKVEEAGEAQPYVPYVHKEVVGDDNFLEKAREEAAKWAIERAEVKV